MNNYFIYTYIFDNINNFYIYNKAHSGCNAAKQNYQYINIKPIQTKPNQIKLTNETNSNPTYILFLCSRIIHV